MAAKRAAGHASCFWMAVFSLGLARGEADRLWAGRRQSEDFFPPPPLPPSQPACGLEQPFVQTETNIWPLKWCAALVPPSDTLVVADAEECNRHYVNHLNARYVAECIYQQVNHTKYKCVLSWPPFYECSPPPSMPPPASPLPSMPSPAPPLSPAPLVADSPPSSPESSPPLMPTQPASPSAPILPSTPPMPTSPTSASSPAPQAPTVSPPSQFPLPPSPRVPAPPYPPPVPCGLDQPFTQTDTNIWPLKWCAALVPPSDTPVVADAKECNRHYVNNSDARYVAECIYQQVNYTKYKCVLSWPPFYECSPPPSMPPPASPLPSMPSPAPPLSPAPLVADSPPSSPESSPPLMPTQPASPSAPILPSTPPMPTSPTSASSPAPQAPTVSPPSQFPLPPSPRVPAPPYPPPVPCGLDQPFTQADTNIWPLKWCAALVPPSDTPVVADAYECNRHYVNNLNARYVAECIYQQANDTKYECVLSWPPFYECSPPPSMPPPASPLPSMPSPAPPLSPAPLVADSPPSSPESSPPLMPTQPASPSAPIPPSTPPMPTSPTSASSPAPQAPTVSPPSQFPLPPSPRAPAPRSP
eukprot:scaffold9324_cov115-Isochrysis_galbana.AAC.1